MKTLLISHTDLDGISCNLLLDLANIKYDYFNVEIEELPATIDKVIADSKKYDQVYITDLTVAEEDYQKLRNARITFQVFDHHNTHLYAQDFKEATIKVFKNKRKACATELFYDHLKKTYSTLKTTSIASYIELVRQIDTYTMVSDDPRSLATLLYIYGKKEFLKKMKLRLTKDKELFTFTNFEKQYLKIHNKEFDLYYEQIEKKLKFYQIHNYTCGVVFCGNTDKSELGNRLSLKHPHLDLIILIDASKSISYRTERDDIDVSQFAQFFGGGGHIKASGSKFDDDDRENIIKSYFKDVKRLENDTN